MRQQPDYYVASRATSTYSKHLLCPNNETIVLQNTGNETTTIRQVTSAGYWQKTRKEKDHERTYE